MPTKSLLAATFSLALLPGCSESQGDDGASTGGSATGGAGMSATGGSSANGGMAGGGLSNGGAGTGGTAFGGSAGIGGSAGGAATAGSTGDDRLFVPEDLPNTELDGGGGLTLVAFTLIEGATGGEFYAAVRNDGQTPACEAGMMIDFYDKAGALVTSTSGTLQTGKLYRLSQGEAVHVWCIPPGAIAMTSGAGITGVVIDELGHLEHRFPAFGIEVIPVEGLGVTGVAAVTSGGRTAYTGTLANGLDAAVMNPKVSVFPVNRVGRPLGLATATEALSVPAAGTWTFETSTVVDAGVDHAAYPNATLPQ